jgi:dienelactone hydrolase
MKRILLLVAVLVTPTLAMRGAEPGDPFIPYLDGKAPEVLRELSASDPDPEGITTRRVVFRSRDDSEIFAVIANPKAPGKHPAMLVLHGGGGSAEIEKAKAWAQRGYVAIAPDLPGIADPKKITESKGRWSGLKYGESRWVATPDVSESVLFDAVLSAMKSLYLLRAQPSVDTSNIGVVGISWGGYMTTMVCGLAGDQVQAGFALYGCGFFDLGSQSSPTNAPYNPKLPRTSLARLLPEERERWLNGLDAGRRAPGMKAAYYLAAATNDFFGWPRAAQATLDAIPGAKNHLFAPNANHKIPVPGGDISSTEKSDPNFVPTAFQPYPTPKGQKANWLSMEVPYFDYHLKGIGKPFPTVMVLAGKDARVARFRVTAPHPLTQVEVFWSQAAPAVPTNDDIKNRVWQALPATKRGEGYEAQLPADAGEWFALVSDDRPVTVSSNMIHIQTALIEPAD